MKEDKAGGASLRVGHELEITGYGLGNCLLGSELRYFISSPTSEFIQEVWSPKEWSFPLIEEGCARFGLR